MRYLVVLIGGGLLAGLAVLPLPEKSPSEKSEYERGFNEGFQRATACGLETAQRMGAGEFYYDEDQFRMSFRWYGKGHEPPEPHPHRRTPERRRPQSL